MAGNLDPSLSWEDIRWLRGITRLPLLLKGIVCAEDALRAAHERLADGIIVSNHGGRQLDGAPATLEALAEISDAFERHLSPGYVH